MTKQNSVDPISSIALLTPATENHSVGADAIQVAPGDREARYSLRRFLLGGTAVIALALFAWPMLPRVYESTATLVLRPTDNEGQTDYAQAMRQPLDENSIVSALDAFGSVALAQSVIDANQLAMDDEFKVKQGLTGRVHNAIVTMLDGVLPQTLARDTPAPSAKDLMAGNASPEDAPDAAKLRNNLWAKLVVNRNRLSYTVNVGFRSNDPLKAAMLTRSLVSAYLDTQVRRKAENVDGMNRLLEDHVRQARDRADKSAAEMEAFLEKSGLIDQGAQISLESQLSALSTELATARAHAIDARTRADNLELMKSKGTLDSAPEVLASPTIQRLNQSLTESMSRLAVMSTESRNIMEQAQVERDRIVASVRVEADNWDRREQLLSAEIDKIRQDMIERRKASLQLDQLRREAENDAQVLADAQTRLKTRAPTLEALKPDAEVLSPATVPVKPVFPILPLYVAGSLGMAFLAGAGMNASAIRRDAKRLLKI